MTQIPMPWSIPVNADVTVDVRLPKETVLKLIGIGLVIILLGILASKIF